MYTICIDAGHGGSDPGASGNGVVEKDIVLTVIKKVGKLLKDKNFNVVYTRLSDTFIKLNDRCRIANNAKADLFVSVHINSAANTTAAGTETLCYTNNDFAKTMHKHLMSKLNRKDRGVKIRQDLAVLNGTKMNAVLLELAFLSNKEEAELLKKESFLDSAAQAIYDGVCDFLGVKENTVQDTTVKCTPNVLEASKKAIDVTVDGKTTYTDGYFIEGKNLFTADFIRTLDYDVKMDPNTKVVEFNSNLKKSLKVIVNGKEETVNSIFKDDLNYVQLRELANLGLFNLDYKDGVVYINSIK